jgi:thiamine-phosphate diphosphorylase
MTTTTARKNPMSLFLVNLILLTILFMSFDLADALTSQSSSQEATQRVPERSSCWLALITEPDACDSDERMEQTYLAIQRATTEKRKVNLVSIRLTRSDSYEVFQRAVELTKRLVQLSSSSSFTNKGASFQVVCSSDWVEAAVKGGAHGIHVKEQHLSQIRTIRNSFDYDIWIGTSAHSVESAKASFQLYEPDYYFVGTCFVTASHPEKSLQDLEGPTLPGAVKRALQELLTEDSPCPTVVAIGGIDQGNCHVPIQHGADGVAVIRSVMQAKDPSAVVSAMQQRMNCALTSTSTSDGFVE